MSGRERTMKGIAGMGRVLHRHRSAGLVGGIIVAAVVVIALLVVFWEWLSAGESGSTTIRNIALVLAGVVALPLALWRSVVADSQAKTAQRGLLNERYQKGAEMLASEVLAVRLAGIYALQNLAREHPDEYHTQTMRLFCAFVRLPTRDQSLESGQAAIRPGSLLGLRQDVESIMGAIGSRERARIAVERRVELRLDLRGADLREVQILGADLSQAMFQHSELSGAWLANVDLTDASLVDANLSRAQFYDVNLTGTNLWSANLSGAMLQDAQMGGRRNLHNVNLTGANLGGANLSEGILQNATVAKAWLERANLAGANFQGADLFQARLMRADLFGTDFLDANLTGANMSEANVSGAQFSNNGLQAAKGLTQEQLDKAQSDPNNPPKLVGVLDAETGEQLIWRGKSLDEGV